MSSEHKDIYLCDHLCSVTGCITGIILMKKVLDVSWIKMSVTGSEQMHIAHGQLIHHSRVIFFIPRGENTSLHSSLLSIHL